MRKRMVAVVIFSAWFVDGCASTQCEMGEIKVADTCIRPRARDGSIDDAASVTAGPNTLDASGPREPDLLRDARPPSDSMRDAGFYQRDDASVGDACSPSPEVCNGVDDDCNAQIDDGLTVYCWIDADGDGFAPSSAVGTSRCGECGVGETNVDPTGAMQSDCDDSDARRSPSLSDVCGDSIDNDCDGTPDDEQKNACGGSCSVQLAWLIS